MATKKQSRPKVKGLVNPRGVTRVFGTPIDFKALPEKITIGRRVANGKFKLEAHYPAKQFNDKQAYIDKRKEGSYCRFYDNKSPFFIARTVWDATSQPGMHMITKVNGETHRFIVTPKVDDPTKASVIGSYLVHRDNGDPVLCSGVIGELEAVGDDGDFKVIPYQQHGIRCPKFDSDRNELAGHIPKTFEYKKSTKPRGPRKTAADYCKPSHTFKHPTDIKKAEYVEEMDDMLDDDVSCLKCSWDGTYEDLVFVDITEGGGGYDFALVCPLCEDDEWLDDMMAESYDEPCFSCDGIGTWDDGDCSYCEGSGLMSDSLRAEMALFKSEYFDADCGCFKKGPEAKTLSFMDWAKQEEASHLKRYGAEETHTCAECGKVISADMIIGDGTNRGLCCVPDYYDDEDYYAEGKKNRERSWLVKEYPHTITKEQHDEINRLLDEHDPNGNIFYVRYGDTLRIITPHGPLKASWLPTFSAESGQFPSIHYGDHDSNTQEKYQEFLDEWDGDNEPPSLEEWIKELDEYDRRLQEYEGTEEYRQAMEEMSDETFEAPYAGAGSLMGIKGGSSLTNFTPSELTESSAIHGDFDQASLNYSGHQNLEARAEDWKHECISCAGGMDELVAKGQSWSCECCGLLVGTEGYHEDCGSNNDGVVMCSFCESGQCDCGAETLHAEHLREAPKWAKLLGWVGAFAVGYISAQMIDNAKE